MFVYYILLLHWIILWVVSIWNQIIKREQLSEWIDNSWKSTSLKRANKIMSCYQFHDMCWTNSVLCSLYRPQHSWSGNQIRQETASWRSNKGQGLRKCQPKLWKILETWMEMTITAMSPRRQRDRWIWWKIHLCWLIKRIEGVF